MSNINGEYIRCATSVCLNVYVVFALERVLTLSVAIVLGCDVTTWYIRYIMTFGLIVATLILFLLRIFELSGLLRRPVYRLNQLHLFSDIIAITFGCVTVLETFWMFKVYMFIVVMNLIYDLILNVHLLINADDCVNRYSMSMVRLHTYTKRGYAKCSSIQHQ